MNFIVVKISLFFLVVSKLFWSQNTLEINLNIGDTFIVTQTATQQIIQDMDGSIHTMSNQMERDFSILVTAKSDSSYLLNFKFKSFKLKTTSNLYGELMNIDTNLNNKESHITSNMFSELTNSVLKINMLKTGKILNISGAEAMIMKMVDRANIQDTFTKELTIEALKKEYGNKSLSRSFEQMTYFYPTKKVATNDHWTNRYSGNLKALNNWTLVANQKNIILNAKSQVSLTSQEDSYIMELEGTQNTDVQANKTTGFPERITVTSNTNGTTVMNGMENLKIPTTIISKTIYKTKKHVQ